MEKTHYFKLKLGIDDNNDYFLSIIPTSHWHKPVCYPINFSQLNVPIIIIKNSFENGNGLEYLLDFDSSTHQAVDNVRFIDQ